MTLTTQTGIEAAENVQTDLGVKTGNVRLPNGQVISEDAQLLFDKSICAKPLGTPAQEQIRIKNSSYQYRWVNRGTDVASPLYAKRKAQGWTLATLSDAEPMSVEITADSGEIRMFDVVLMKIPIEKYQAAMKYNMMQALRLQRDKRFLTGVDGEAPPSTDVFSDDKAVVHAASELDKSDGTGKYIKTFEVSESELDAKMGKDTIKQGRK